MCQLLRKEVALASQCRNSHHDACNMYGEWPKTVVLERATVLFLFTCDVPNVLKVACRDSLSCRDAALIAVL